MKVQYDKHYFILTEDVETPICGKDDEQCTNTARSKYSSSFSSITENKNNYL